MIMVPLAWLMIPTALIAVYVGVYGAVYEVESGGSTPRFFAWATFSFAGCAGLLWGGWML